nr:G-type lectin S-receptor-like serine/threonine-protein kinase At1g67520 [Ipomoea batatas]
MFFLLFLCSLPSIASSSQSDTLKQGDALNSSSLLVSANNNFTLGFFTPNGTNRTYIAIHSRASYSTDPVWIGNRETPLPTNSSPTLQIDASGRLLILTHDEGQGNSYLLSSKQTTLNVTATLLDSGNFVLREVNSDGEELWSSFDNPTDTLLPGMKLGVNHRTGRNWSLTSWQDNNIPAAGAFSLEWEPTKRRMVIKYRGVTRWTSGELMNSVDFQYTSFNSTFTDHTFKFVNVSTKDEEYLSYAVTPVSTQNRNAGWRLDSQGVLYDVVGNQFIIDVGRCYGYENETQQSLGCELWEQPKCSPSRSGETFEQRYGRFMRDSQHEAEQETMPNNSSDCREHCWNLCDCVGYRSYPDEGSCGYWRGTDLQFDQDNSRNTIPLFRLIRPDKGKSPSKTWIWILIPIAVSTVLVVLLLLRRRRRKREEARKEQELKDLLTLEEYSDIEELSSGENGSLKVFSYAWVVTTTNNFSSDYKLGQGGFGSVYKEIKADMIKTPMQANKIFNSQDELVKERQRDLESFPKMEIIGLIILESLRVRLIKLALDKLGLHFTLAGFSERKSVNFRGTLEVKLDEHVVIMG